MYACSLYTIVAFDSKWSQSDIISYDNELQCTFFLNAVRRVCQMLALQLAAKKYGRGAPIFVLVICLNFDSLTLYLEG